MSVDKKEVIMVDVDLIEPDPNQPRTEFSEEEIAATAFTIDSQGVINPIEIDDNYMIVTGEIRWRAAQKAGLKQIPCVIWHNGTHKRFERQVVENLHHHQLSDRDREAAIVKLWKTGQYPTQDQLAKAVGLARTRISQILEANQAREEIPEIRNLNVSTNIIVETAGLETEKRIRLLKAADEGTVSVPDIRVLRQIAKTSDALFNKTMQKEIPLARALETAEAMQDIEKRGVALTEDQKQNLADKVAEDETLLDKYKDAVLEKVKQVASQPKTQPRITEPIGRTSPVQNIIKVKDEVMDHFKIYLGNCDHNERRWAKRLMIEIRDELSLLIEMIKED